MADITIATQHFVDIEKIKNGVITLKKGGVRKILIVSGVNFDLKSEDEQSLILRTFQNFLNSLDFSAQFFIHSRKVNISAYLEYMLERKEEETNELLKIQIEEYVDFIKSFIEDNAIINKSFFVSVPYDSAALENKTKSGVFDFFKKKAPQNVENLDERAKLEQLDHRVSQIIQGLEQIGLRVTPLEDDEIVELFYNLYNPQLVEKKELKITKEQAS